MMGQTRQDGAHLFAVFSTWFRRLLPAPLTHIPSEEEMERNADLTARSTVMQHAEGSVLLGEGKFEIARDLMESDADRITGA